MASVYTHSKFFKQRNFLQTEKLLHTTSFYTEKFLHTASFHTQQAFTEHLHTVLLNMASVYTHRNFYTETLLHTEKLSKLLHTKSFTHSKLSHTASVYTENTYTQCFYTWQAFTHTASFLNREAFTDGEAFTHNKLLHREAFTHSKLSHTASFYRTLTHSAFKHGKRLHTQKLLHRDAFTHREAFTHSKLLHTKSFTHSTLLQKKVLTLLHREAFSYIITTGNCSSKTGSRRQSEQKTILKHFLKELLKGKLLAPKLRKSADKSLSQLWCSHSNTICEIQLQKTMVLRMLPRHQATLTQPLYNAICRDRVAKHKRTTRNGVGNCSSKIGYLDATTKKRRFWSSF